MVPGLHNMITQIAPVVRRPTPYGAVFELNWLSASGTACFLATLATALVLRARLEGALDFPHEGPCKHEFVASARNLTAQGIHATDLAKGLLERGFYAPTIYFPLIVPEAVMVEPTETESKATLDAFTEAVLEIVQLAQTDPERLRAEPTSLPVGRLDEVAAARHPVLRWRPPAQD